MKRLTRNFSNQDLIALVVTAVLSLGIWFAGPYLIIANHAPLFAIEKRLAIIMVLFLGWLLLSLILSNSPAVEKAPDYPPDIMKKLFALQGRFEGAITFLKKTFINRHEQNINLLHLPWFILIGPQQSGKTTLLANANVNFILSKQFKPELLQAIPPSEACDWWVTNDLVLVDIPSSYIHHKQKIVENLLWHKLLNLIHQHRQQDSLNGIVIALNLPELMKKNQHQKIITSLKKRISDIKKTFGSAIPCHIIITKCDLLPGFTEFFADSSTDELAQSWGITLHALKSNQGLSESITHRFNTIIKRLNKQLIWRLHQERSLQARSLIKDFPLHIERLKEATEQFVRALSLPDLRLNSIFFTSAIQPKEKETTTAPCTIDHNQQALQILQDYPLESKPYFIKQLISQALLHNTEAPIADPAYQKIVWHRRAVYAASAAVITLAGILLGYDFQHGVKEAYAIQNNLAQYQLYMQQANQADDHFTKALSLLNGLQVAEQNSRHPLSHLADRLAFFSKKSRETTADVYVKALQTIVLPEIKHVLEARLQTTNEKNPLQLYLLTKAYLMLADKQHRDPNFIISLIKPLLTTTLTPDMSMQLNNHLYAALTLDSGLSSLHPEVIAQARRQLASLPSEELAYIILKSMNNNNLESTITLGTNSEHAPVFISKELASQIPNMFTAEGLKANLAGETITLAATEALQGNWVTGRLTNNTVDATQLAEEVRTRYITNYIDVWESQLANIRLYTPTSLADLNVMLEALTSNNSPLLQMLQTIQKNTNFDIITAASPKLQTLDALISNVSSSQDNLLYQMFASFRELDLYVKDLLSTDDVDAAIAQAVKRHHLTSADDPIARITKLAKHMQDPMKTWLVTLAAQSWELIAHNS